jgi:hypothetical protein
VTVVGGVAVHVIDGAVGDVTVKVTETETGERSHLPVTGSHPGADVPLKVAVALYVPTASPTAEAEKEIGNEFPPPRDPDDGDTVSQPLPLA